MLEYIFVEHQLVLSSYIVEELKKKDIWVRDYRNGILKGWIRVSTGSIACMQKFWNAFNKIQ